MNRPCPVCGAGPFREHTRLLSHIDEVPMGLDRSRDVAVAIDRCQSCSVLITRDADADPDALYAEQSISLEASHAKAMQFQEREIYSTDELAFVGAPPGRLLDVGCSSGYFLAKARGSGWDVVGTELDRKAAELARNTFGVTVIEGDVRGIPFRDGEFDAVTLWGVLEHLPDPMAYLSHLRRLLADRGRLVVAVPNAGSLNRTVSSLSRHGWDMFLEPGHLIHFTRTTLARLGTRAGLDVAEWGTMTCAIRGKLPFMPTRRVLLERRVDHLDRSSPAFRGAYRGFLRLLDKSRLGDILVVAFRKHPTA